MSTNNILPKALHDILVTRNFDFKELDSSTGQTPLDDNGDIDFGKIDLITFHYIGPSGRNYGTVIITLDNGNLQLFFGDKFGKTMEPEDKKDWFGSNTSQGFLEQLKKMSVRHNFSKFQISNPPKLKYTRQGIAAIKQGILEESFSGNRKISYTNEARQARLMIRHSRPLADGQPRHQCIESLFIETADGERFKLPFRKLSGGRAMLEHVRQGGRPYDMKGQHIQEMVEQINVLAQFRRANQNRILEGDASNLVSAADQHYTNLRKNLKAIATPRGYGHYFESWSPMNITDNEIMVEDIKNLFVEQTIDPRIENALPILMQIRSTIKEADDFENWADNVIDPINNDTEGEKEELVNLLQQPLIAGPNGIDASEQLYDLLHDKVLSDIIKNYANEVGPEANVWESPEVMARLHELNVVIPNETSQQVDEAIPLAAIAAGLARTAAPYIATHAAGKILGLDDAQENAWLERVKYLAKPK
jgi:hypothetical protein